MEQWAMYTTEGNELTRGMQLPKHKADVVAQATADRIGQIVELVEEGKIGYSVLFRPTVPQDVG